MMTSPTKAQDIAMTNILGGDVDEPVSTGVISMNFTVVVRLTASFATKQEINNIFEIK